MRKWKKGQNGKGDGQTDYYRRIVTTEEYFDNWNRTFEKRKNKEATKQIKTKKGDN